MEGPEPHSEKPIVSPAPAIQASALLALSLDHQTKTATWCTGIKSLDTALPKDTWNGGRVIGIVGDSGQLVEQILTTHLLHLPPATNGAASKSTANSSPPPTSAYIIAPHSTAIVPTLHSLLKAQSHPAPLSLLSTVLLLQHLDLIGLIESLSEVSSHLSHSSSHPPSSPQTKTILYISPFTHALLSTLRRSGPTRTNALLASLLRSITHLSRTYPGVLVLLGLGVRRGSGQGDQSDQEDTPTTIPSAFATGDGRRTLCLDPVGTLGRTLEAGMDVLVLLHDPRGGEGGGSVVEVVKDRVGCGLGVWGLWKR